MDTAISKNRSLKSQKNSELKKSKTQAMLFFLRGLDESVDINQLEEFSSLQYLSFDEQQQMIRSFKNLPHPDLMFYQTINTYRASKILKILGENINPVYLKKFSRADSTEKNSKENKIECQLILKMIESNRQAYHDVLQLFIESFEKNVRQKWEKNEPNLLEQHLERQKKLFTQRNDRLQKDSNVVDILEKLEPVSSSPVKEELAIKTSLPLASTSQQNLQSIPIPTNENLVNPEVVIPTQDSSEPLEISNNLEHKTEIQPDQVKDKKEETKSKTTTTIDAQDNFATSSVKKELISSNSKVIEPLISQTISQNSQLPEKTFEEEDIYEKAQRAINADPSLVALFDISGWN